MKIKCAAAKTGFWIDRLVYSKDDWRNKHKGTADTFDLDERAFRYDPDGKILVNKDMTPILPKWVMPLAEVPKIDAGKYPVCVIDSTKQTREEKRRMAQAALADPEPKMDDDAIELPKKRGPGRPRKSDENVLA